MQFIIFLRLLSANNCIALLTLGDKNAILTSQLFYSRLKVTSIYVGDRPTWTKCQ